MQQVNAPNRRLRSQVALEKLQQELSGGRYAVGDKLPSLSQMARTMGINHATLRRGLQSLVQRGVLQVRPRVGVFVAEAPTTQRKVMRVVLGCRTYLQQGAKTHPAIAAYLDGASAVLQPRGWGLQVMFYDKNRLIEQIGPALLEQEISGLIICDGGVTQRDFEFLRSNGIRVVDCSLMDQNLDWLVSVRRQPAAIARECVEHLRHLGHRRIAFVHWVQSGDGGAIHQRIVQLIMDHQLGDPLELLIKVDNPERNPQWEQINRFFDLAPLPTAVVAADEGIVDFLLAGCERRGIRVPEDLSVVAMHDALPQGHPVPVTAPDSIAECSQMIRLASEALVREIEGSPLSERKVVVSFPLVMKASSGPAPANGSPPRRSDNGLVR